MSVSSVKNQGTYPNQENNYNNDYPSQGTGDSSGYGDSSFGLDNEDDLFGLEYRDGESPLDEGFYDDYGMGDDYGEGEMTLLDQIEELLKTPNLSDAKRKELTRMATQLSINPKSEELLVGQLEALSIAIMEEAVYSPAALRLNTELGLEDAGAAEALLRKYDIDGDSKFISPDKLAMLAQDPMILEATAELKSAHDMNVKTLSDKIPGEIQAAHDQNTLTDTKDSSMISDANPEHHKWLYDTANGKSAECQAVNASALALAEKTAAIFSAVTGSEVKADATPAQAGMVQLPDGTAFNAVKQKIGGEAIQRPEIEMVEFHVDMEGDGKGTIQPWMKDAKYPLKSTDDGGISFAAIFTTVLTGGLASPIICAVDAAGYSPDVPYTDSGE